MGCEGCGTTNGKTPTGCGNKGYCVSGGCSKLEVYDWLSDVAAPAYDRYDIHEISFKNGARKDFYRNVKRHDIETGDFVLVETGTSGYDIGKVTLSGELVKLQMKKKLQGKNRKLEPKNIIRRAKDIEMDRLKEARSREKETMLRARVMARDLGLDMKLGDVEYQADLRKATFFYTADERVDFRELIKVLAKEFRVKIEMRQIGTRQEAGRVGGIGACGRELCCSSWLTNFKSVNTTAARYQNLSINQTKLSGQCGRLKCCLNYELDTYLDALKDFPKEENARRIKTAKGIAFLFKTDILKGIMTYSYPESNTFYHLSIAEVKLLLEMNKGGAYPEDLAEHMLLDDDKEVEEFEDLVGQISLKELEKTNRKKRQKNRRQNPSNKKKGSGQGRPQNKGGQQNRSNKKKSNSQKRSNHNSGNDNSKSSSRPKNQSGNKPGNNKRRKNRRNRPNKGGQDS